MNARGRRTRTRLCSLATGTTLVVALVLAAPAGADWLVMTDGTQVETDGPWTERGKLVVFTDTSGNLVSLRLSEIDLAASRQATADAIAAANRPAPPPPPPPKSVFSITDADVGHLDPEDEEGEGGGSGESEEAEEAPPTVVVIGWDGDESGENGVQIRATLENQGEDVAVGLSVSVTIYDSEGTALATTAAQLAATGLVPGETTDLVANFSDVFDFTAVNFDVEHRSLATRAAEDVPEAGEAVPVDG